MGTTYQVIMLDEFDWAYADRTKETVIAKVLAELPQGRGVELITTFPGGIVLNLEKVYPWADENMKIIRDNCDNAYIRHDNSCSLAEIWPK